MKEYLSSIDFQVSKWVIVRLSMGFDGTVLMLTLQQFFSLKVHFLKTTPAPNCPVSY